MSTPAPIPDPESGGTLPAPGNDPHTPTPPMEEPTDATPRGDTDSPSDGPVPDA
ncbi:hypothetical protein QFZ24_003264 [Streptomyces phaeochromogenes]|nr:hypothetical protein [Streptomyces phaeochromogenes]